LWSWWQIFLKLFQLRRATRDTERIRGRVLEGRRLDRALPARDQARLGGGLEHIFTAGFREYSKHRRQGSTSAVTLDSARRAMRAAYQREIDALERISPDSRPSGRCRPTSACSEPYGAS
jgi:biopolymer transport protein TolQ